MAAGIVALVLFVLVVLVVALVPVFMSARDKQRRISIEKAQAEARLHLLTQTTLNQMQDAARRAQFGRDR